MGNTERGEFKGSGKPVRQRTERHSRWNTWAIIVAAVIAVLTAALGWLQLQSVERAVGMNLPNTRFTGYDAAYLNEIQERITPAVVERYQSFHYFWDLVFPLAFAALIILLVHRFASGNPLRWLFYFVALAFAAVDIAENFVLEAALASADVEASLASTASVLTTLTWILLVATILAFVLSFLLNRPTTSARKFG